MARKVICALCVFFIFTAVLCGCGSGSGKTAVTDFSADFTAVYREMNLSGTIIADRHGLLSVALDSPETLGGVNISYKNGETELRREDLICTADEGYLPEKSFPRLIKNALSALNSEVNGEGKYTPQNGKYALEKDGVNYEVFLDENGFITKITAENELEIEFTEITKNG